MNKYLPILNKALKDSKVEGLVCISPDYKKRLSEIIKDMPSEAYLTEWRYGVGEIYYVYYMHTNGIGPKLKEAFEKDFRGGHPKLTAVYQKKELEHIIQKF
jgi:hypothetical protein